MSRRTSSAPIAHVESESPVPVRSPGATRDDSAALEALAQVIGAEAAGRRWMSVARHPIVTVRGLSALTRLPEVEVPLSNAWAGRTIDRRLSGRHLGISTGRLGRAVLTLPDDPAAYLRGHARQALRTNLHRARDLGISCRRVDDPDDQALYCTKLLTTRGWQEPLRQLAEQHDVRPGEGIHYAALDSGGDVLAVAVTVEDTVAACLLWMMATPDHTMSTGARYALSAHVAMGLAATGRRLLFLADPMASSPGLRYFQHRLGFGLANLTVIGL